LPALDNSFPRGTAHISPLDRLAARERPISHGSGAEDHDRVALFPRHLGNLVAGRIGIRAQGRTSSSMVSGIYIGPASA
jgi:hypothetical protein